MPYTLDFFLSLSGMLLYIAYGLGYKGDESYYHRGGHYGEYGQHHRFLLDLLGLYPGVLQAFFSFSLAGRISFGYLWPSKHKPLSNDFAPDALAAKRVRGVVILVYRGRISFRP
jgi:hypothetical protein